MTRWPMTLIFCALLLVPGASVACAQAPFKTVTVGEWIVYEDLEYDGPTPPKPKGIPTAAQVAASGDRKATIHFACSKYDSAFYLEKDETFQDTLSRTPGYIAGKVYQFVYTKVDKDEYLWETVATNASYFFFEAHVETLMRGANLMICPTNNEKDSACLNFSLRGFTAAVKIVCPKR